MNLYDVVLLTDSRYVDPSMPDQYVRNILQEDQFVREALQKRGVSVTRKDWADPTFDWSSTSSVLFRSTWDYFDRFTEFRAWLKTISPLTKLINNHSLIEWNVDKHYLSDLKNAGIRVIPTRYIEVGSGLSLQGIHTITGWTETVIKPTIGGAGRHTYRVNADNISVIANKLESTMKQESFMLQPFQYSVTTKGEVSLMFFGENFSHAVLKKAQSGDFRVQDDFGGTVELYQPTEEEIVFGRNAVQACPEMPAYARVDFIRDNNGFLAISELELIEPELWFRMKPDAASLLADEVVTRITS